MQDAAGIAALAAAVASSGGSSDSLLSGLVAQLWSHISVALAKSVKETVEPSFKDLPGPLSTLHFTKLNFGTVPIRIDNTIVHERQDDLVKFDIDIVWNSDCHIELDADYTPSFGVRSLKFHGRMSVLLAPLTDSLPVVSAIQYGFINPPKLELDFTGLADLADWSMIDKRIRGIIQDTIAGMLVLPNRMIFKMDPANSFLDTYQPPVGVVRVTLQSGTGFEQAGRRFLRDEHDVYCNLTFGASPSWRSSTKNNCAAPEWNESKDFVLFDHDQVIQVQALDEDVANEDDDLGCAFVTVREILLAGKTIQLDLTGASHQGAKVTLRCDMCNLAPVKQDIATQEDENLLAALVTILVTKASDIALPKEEVACFVRVKYGEEHEFVSGTIADGPGIDALNPVYDCAFHVPLSPSRMDKKESVEFQLVQKGKDDETVLGSFCISHEDLMESPNMSVTGQRSIGDQGTALEFQVSLRFVQPPSEVPIMFGSAAVAPSSSSSSRAPLGTVRLTVAKGWGFVDEKRRMRLKKDVPDVYCQLTFGSSPRIWRTPTIPNSKTPEWNVSADYHLSDHGQIVTITAYDEDKGRRDKDDELGSARITIGKLLLASDLVDVELQKVGKPTGLYIALRGDMVG